MSPLTEAAHCCVRKLLQHSPSPLQSGIHHSTAKSPLKSWGCISSTGCCQETSSSTYPVSAEELPQVKPLATPCLPLPVQTHFPHSGFGSVPGASAPSRAGRWAGASGWGSGLTHHHFSHLKGSSYPARSNGRAGAAGEGARVRGA